MRITCPTIDDFIENLTAASGLFQNTIWCSTTKRPEDGKSPHDAVKFAVVIQMSAVAVYDEDAEALVEVGVDCGTDYMDASQEYKGTARADELKGQVTQVATEHGWRMLPGLIDT